jgi:hypothetical protein
MNLKIRKMDWYKRRLPTKDPKPIKSIVKYLEFIENYICIMTVTYDDGNVYDLTARVNQNKILKTWTVHGIDSKGHTCLCDIEV